MRRRTLLAFALAGPLVHPYVRARSATSTFAEAGVSFVAPAGWSADDEPDGKAIFFLLLSGPNVVDASLMIELFSDESAGDLQAALDSTLNRIRSRRLQAHAVRVSTERTPIGLRYGRIRYYVREGGTKFDAQYMVLPIRETVRVNVFATYASEFAPRHEPTVSRFLHSIRVAT